MESARPPKDNPPPPETRLQKLRRQRRDRGYEPRLPEADGGAELLEWFWDVGPAAAGAPISHTELAHWQENTGFRLQSWQARLLRRMSQEYLAEVHRAADEKCEPPCRLEDFKPSAASVAMSLRESMRALADT